VIRPLAALAALLLISFQAFASTPVAVNTADAATLAASLNGVGMSKAEAIVAYREEHGPFKSLGDMAAVKGIGMALLERNRDAIQFETEVARPKKASKARKEKEGEPREIAAE
jgi:competence protein ComEA